MLKKILVLIFCLWSSVAFGADVYVDPSCEFNGDGTVGTCATSDGGTGAYKITPDDFTFNDDNSKLYFKRGTTMDLSTKNGIGQRIQIYGTNVEILPYGLGDKPIIKEYSISSNPSDWEDLGNNIWRWHDTSTTINTPYILGLGNINSEGIRVPYFKTGTPLTARGQWDSRAYSEGNNNEVYLYSEGNPITYYGGNIYLQRLQFYVFRVRASGCSIHDIDIKYSYVGVQVSNGESSTIDNVHVYNCDFERCVYGVYPASSSSSHPVTNLEVNNNIFRNMLKSAYSNTGHYVLSNKIHDNKVYSCGLSVSTGAFYDDGTIAANWEEGNEFYRNYVEDEHYGNYWPDDGACYYADMNSRYSKWHNNIAKDSPLAFIMHTGFPLKMYYNVSYACLEGFRLNAMDPGDSTIYDRELYNNTFIDCGSVNHYNACGYISSLETLNSAILRNNIFTINDGIDSAILYSYWTQHGVNKVIESNNLSCGAPLIFGINPNEEITPDTSDINTDPILHGYHISSSLSPARNAGLTIPDIHESWPNWAKDIDGDPIVDTPDIGADEFRIKPNIGDSKLIENEAQ